MRKIQLPIALVLLLLVSPASRAVTIEGQIADNTNQMLLRLEAKAPEISTTYSLNGVTRSIYHRILSARDHSKIQVLVKSVNGPQELKNDLQIKPSFPLSEKMNVKGFLSGLEFSGSFQEERPPMADVVRREFSKLLLNQTASIGHTLHRGLADLRLTDKRLRPAKTMNFGPYLVTAQLRDYLENQCVLVKLKAEPQRTTSADEKNSLVQWEAILHFDFGNLDVRGGMQCRSNVRASLGTVDSGVIGFDQLECRLKIEAHPFDAQKGIQDGELRALLAFLQLNIPDLFLMPY